MAITVDSSPTKEFFVEMLTRDIDLTDAILDLLDNCLDGVLRKRGSMDIKRDDFDYSGFEANITIEKSHLTGWGESGIPKYHTQFIGIKGVVSFKSTNPKLLPTTTTKRGIDLSSEVYSQVKRAYAGRYESFHFIY